MRDPAHSSPHPEDGFALIEVLVSALIVVIVGGAVLTTLQATARSAGDSRNHSMAQAIAQEDQARLRSMRISSLNRLNQSYPVTLDGTTFSVTSTGVFVNNISQTASCSTGQTSADYIRISSSVTWNGLGTRPPVTMTSIVSPSNGSLDPGHGTLTISTINAAGLPLPGVGVSGTGAGTFSGTTDASGCANFADLPAGKYTMTPTAAGMVDKEGKAPTSQLVEVNASGTQTSILQYDRPGALEVNFKYRVGSSAEFKTSTASSIQVFNSGLKEPFTFSTSNGLPAAAVSTTGKLFPFPSPYAVYAGACKDTNPNPDSNPAAPGALASVGVTVPPGATLAPLPIGTIQLPALNLVVKRNGALLEGAKVRITGTCSFDRNYLTTAAGVLPDPGLPWGTYKVCASRGSGSSTRRKYVSNVSVQNLTAGTPLTIDLESNTESTSC
jgi:Tfp pilus assembly protein PilV